MIIFHPRHDLTLPKMEIDDIENVINEWINVFLKRGRQPGIKYVQIFEVSRQIHSILCGYPGLFYRTKAQ